VAATVPIAPSASGCPATGTQLSDGVGGPILGASLTSVYEGVGIGTPAAMCLASSLQEFAMSTFFDASNLTPIPASSFVELTVSTQTTMQ
jgi:hypothetical protein